MASSYRLSHGITLSEGVKSNTFFARHLHHNCTMSAAQGPASYGRKTFPLHVKDTNRTNCKDFPGSSSMHTCQKFLSPGILIVQSRLVALQNRLTLGPFFPSTWHAHELFSSECSFPWSSRWGQTGLPGFAVSLSGSPNQRRCQMRSTTKPVVGQTASEKPLLGVMFSSALVFWSVLVEVFLNYTNLGWGILGSHFLAVAIGMAVFKLCILARNIAIFLRYHWPVNRLKLQSMPTPLVLERNDTNMASRACGDIKSVIGDSMNSIAVKEDHLLAINTKPKKTHEPLKSLPPPPPPVLGQSECQVTGSSLMESSRFLEHEQDNLQRGVEQNDARHQDDGEDCKKRIEKSVHVDSFKENDSVSLQARVTNTSMHSSHSNQFGGETLNKLLFEAEILMHFLEKRRVPLATKKKHYLQKASYELFHFVSRLTKVHEEEMNTVRKTFLELTTTEAQDWEAVDRAKPWYEKKVDEIDQKNRRKLQKMTDAYTFLLDAVRADIKMAHP